MLAPYLASKRLYLCQYLFDNSLPLKNAICLQIRSKTISLQFVYWIVSQAIGMTEQRIADKRPRLEAYINLMYVNPFRITVSMISWIFFKIYLSSVFLYSINDFTACKWKRESCTSLGDFNAYKRHYDCIKCWSTLLQSTCKETLDWPCKAIFLIFTFSVCISASNRAVKPGHKFISILERSENIS